MKYLLIIFLLCSQLFAQNVEDIKQEYHNIFSINITEVSPNSTVESRTVNKLPADSEFANLVNENNLLFNYIFEHCRPVDKEIDDSLSRDASTYSWNYIEFLKSSQEFDSCVFPIVSKYLARKKSASAASNNDNKSYTKEDLLRIAVRFFYPDFIMNDKIQAHVCVQINGMSDFPFERDLVLEGFIFQSIFENYRNPDYTIFEDVKNAKQLASNLKLSNDDKTLLIRAQGLVWGAMYNSKDLVNVIKDQYLLKKDILPFSISDL